MNEKFHFVMKAIYQGKILKNIYQILEFKIYKQTKIFM